MTTKARSDQAKQDRLDAILAAARGQFAARGFDAVTMADIAAAAGLAKGTLYLYCRTKEEVFLALMGDAFGDWFAALAAVLAAPATADLAAFGRGLARTAADRPDLRRLVAILHVVLERNATEQILVPFKLGLRDALASLGAALEARFGLAPGEGAAFLIQAYALVIGFSHVDSDSPTVRRLMARGDFAALRVDFEDGLAAALDRLCAGYRPT
jgi:AcrR family transcriptional regulator